MAFIPMTRPTTTVTTSEGTINAKPYIERIRAKKKSSDPDAVFLKQGLACGSNQCILVYFFLSQALAHNRPVKVQLSYK